MKRRKTQPFSDGLTQRQRDQIERFLHLFCDIESLLKGKLKRGRDDRSAVTQLISQYLEKNRLWVSSADKLRTLANIRNVLTHQRGSEVGYPLAVTPNSVAELERIVTSLRTPEPVGQLFRKQVTCVSEDDTLAMVVKLAFEHGFSQFPVLARERFIGLITETEITRWLGHRALNHGTELDLATVYVRAVLCEKEPNEPRVQIFCFARSDASAEEVISLFAVHPTLQVVLLTANGGSRAEIEGIVTQWDAARYPASNGLNLLEPT